MENIRRARGAFMRNWNWVRGRFEGQQHHGVDTPLKTKDAEPVDGDRDNEIVGHIEAVAQPNRTRRKMNNQHPNRADQKHMSQAAGEAETTSASGEQGQRQSSYDDPPVFDMAAYRKCLEDSLYRIHNHPYDVYHTLKPYPTLQASYISSLPWQFSSKRLSDLPSELVARIADFLGPRDRGAIYLTCRALRRVFQMRRRQSRAERAGRGLVLAVEDGLVSFNALAGNRPDSQVLASGDGDGIRSNVMVKKG